MNVRIFFPILFCSVAICFSATVSMAHGEGSPQGNAASQTIVEARAQLAGADQFQLTTDNRAQMEPMSLDPIVVPVSGANIIDAIFIGHPAMLGAFEPGRMQHSPVDNPMLAISTGNASSSSPAPGAAFSGGDTPDQAILRLNLEPEPGRFLLFVTWNLFTTEIPAFSSLGFDDVFSVHVINARGRRKLVEVASSDDRMYPVSNSRAAGSGFDLYSRNPAILPAEYDSGEPAAWMSGWRTTGFAIDPGAPVELEIEVRDGLDGLMRPG